MTIRRVIVIGDKTTHGGIVLQGSHSMFADGKNVAVEGSLVACPQCNGNFPIIEGSPFMHSNGKRVALEGMRTACGAELIASQNKMKIDDGFSSDCYIPTSFTPVPTSTSNFGRKDALKDNSIEDGNQLQYTHYFILKDEQGKPLSNIAYIAKSKTSEHKGKLDANGKTKIISTGVNPEELELFIEINSNNKKRERYITKAVSDVKDKDSFTEYTVSEEKAEIIFIGGAGDQESYYGAGPTRLIRYAERVLYEECGNFNMAHLVIPHIISYSKVYGENNLNELENKLDKSNVIYIVGHSLGGWNGAHLATILANKGYTVRMLVTLDPVGTGVIVGTISGIYWKPETHPKAEKWINVRAESDSFFDISDTIANLGGQWNITSGPIINETVNATHANTVAIFTTKLSTGLSALDYIIQDLQENLSWQEESLSFF